MAKVLIPTPLRQFTGKQDSVTSAGATVGEVLNNLTSSATSNFSFPVTACRLNVSAYTAGAVTLTVLQGMGD